MKNLIALLFSLFLVNSYAQIIESPEAFEAKSAVAVNQNKDLAALTANANRSKKMVATTGVNATYINSSVFTDNATYVKILQQRAAKYDIKNAENYNKKNKSGYNVVFNTDRGNMTVIYDDSGEIKSSQEHYKNVALPKAVIVNIMRVYPDWTFKTNICNIDYKQNKGHVTTYKVKISNGKQSKTIKTDDEGNIS